MKLLVQEYLRSGKTLEQLREEHGVKSSITNGKVCLNYDQIDAKESDPLACQCRGLVLRALDKHGVSTWDTVAVPMFRFFNHGQEQAADIDWNSAAFEEKMDGSCMIVYYDHGGTSLKDSREHRTYGRWCVGTRGRCEADADAHGSGKTFAELFDETVKRIAIGGGEHDINSLMKNSDDSMTYVFELTTPINRVVCKYEDFGLTLLSVRSNNTLIEYPPELFQKIMKDRYDVKLPKQYEFSSPEDMVEVIREWNPEFHEGVVVKDKNFNRIKVKNPAYVAYNHMRDSLATSFRGCMEVILLKKDDDVIHMMPDIIADRIRALKPAVSKLFKHLNADYERLKDIEDMKEFALEAQKCIWPGPLFAMKRGKIKDLDTFIFNKTSGSQIQTSMVDNILSLCKKVDPSIADLM